MTDCHRAVTAARKMYGLTESAGHEIARHDKYGAMAWKRWKTERSSLESNQAILCNGKSTQSIFISASEMTYIVSSGALNSTHSLTPCRILRMTTVDRLNFTHLYIVRVREFKKILPGSRASFFRLEQRW